MNNVVKTNETKKTPLKIFKFYKDTPARTNPPISRRQRYVNFVGVEHLDNPDEVHNEEEIFIDVENVTYGKQIFKALCKVWKFKCLLRYLLPIIIIYFLFSFILPYTDQHSIELPQYFCWFGTSKHAKNYHRENRPNSIAALYEKTTIELAKVRQSTRRQQLQLQEYTLQIRQLEKKIKDVLSQTSFEDRIDYASETLGASIKAVRNIKLYANQKVTTLFGISLWATLDGHDPNVILRDNSQCFQFKTEGISAEIEIKLPLPIYIDSFTVEHNPSIDISTAPKILAVFGIINHNRDDLGTFEYSLDRSSIQSWKAVRSQLSYNIILLKLLSNHGHPTITSLCRFRIHGKKIAYPLL